MLSAAGFQLYLDTTYPLTTQTILTDGQNNVRLFAYQLNTLHLWKDDQANHLRNILWATDTMKLYDRVEGMSVIHLFLFVSSSITFDIFIYWSSILKYKWTLNSE